MEAAMSFPRKIFALLFPLAPLCLGQALHLVPDIAVTEAEYRDAQEAWIQNDPTLFRDLSCQLIPCSAHFQANPEEMRGRIHRAAALADDAMAKKEAYFILFVQRMRDIRTRLSATPESGIPVADLKKDLDEQQMRLLADQDRLDLLLQGFQGDEYLLFRRSVEAERSHLINAQNNIAQRIRSLDTIDKSQRAMQGGEDLSTKMDAIVKIWEQEQASAVQQRTRWAGLYDVMEKSLGKPADERAPAARTAAKTAPSTGGGTARPAAPAAVPRKTGVAAAPEAGISGV